MNYGSMSSNKIHTGWDEMARFERHPHQAKSPEELKEGLEIGGWKIECNLCEAIMWINIDMEGDKHLMREGTIPFEICPICREIHRIAQATN